MLHHHNFIHLDPCEENSLFFTHAYYWWFSIIKTYSTQINEDRKPSHPRSFCRPVERHFQELILVCTASLFLTATFENTMRKYILHVVHIFTCDKDRLNVTPFTKICKNSTLYGFSSLFYSEHCKKF